MRVGGTRGGCKVTWLLRATVLLLAASLLLASAPTRGHTQDHRPNVLIVLTDDQRASGYRRVMPALRRWLGRGGTRFMSAFTAIPNCCPSRASIFTGQYPHNHGVHNNQQGSRLPQDATIQRYLKDAGYRTALYGKYLNGWDLADPPPYFDEFAFFGGGYYDRTWNLNGAIRRLPGYSTKIIQRRAVRFLEGSEIADTDPWFLYLAPWAPHAWYEPEVRNEGAWVGRWDGNPAVFEEDLTDKHPVVGAKPHRFRLRHARKHRRGQLRTLYSVDALLARLRAQLAELGEERDTLVFFMSDNGMLWGEHGLGGPTMGKRFPYTQSVRIPFYVHWPGRVPAGVKDHRLISNVDVAPTILDAASITPDAQYPIDGRSLLDPSARESLLIEYFRDDGHGQQVPPWASLRREDSQYIEYYAADGMVSEFAEFYDLVSDRWQLTNLLLDEHLENDPDIVTLRQELSSARQCSGSSCP